jgi:hypothetical protein
MGIFSSAVKQIAEKTKRKNRKIGNRYGKNKGDRI